MIIPIRQVQIEKVKKLGRDVYTRLWGLVSQLQVALGNGLVLLGLDPLGIRRDGIDLLPNSPDGRGILLVDLSLSGHRED